MHQTLASFRTAALAGLVAGLMLPAGGAMAQEGVFMRDLLGQLGIIPAEKDPIIYRERPPLVVPPSANLPPPAPPAAERTAAWPRDPDVDAAKREAEAARAPVPIRSDQDPRYGGRLSVDQIRAGRRVGGGGAVEPGSDRALYGVDLGPGARHGLWVHPDELRKNARAADRSEQAYNPNQPRRYLSDPPTTLRQPAGTAPVPVNPKRAPYEQSPRDQDERYNAVRR